MALFWDTWDAVEVLHVGVKIMEVLRQGWNFAGFEAGTCNAEPAGQATSLR
jgi:hypothetical protein